MPLDTIFPLNVGLFIPDVPMPPIGLIEPPKGLLSIPDPVGLPRLLIELPLFPLLFVKPGGAARPGGGPLTLEKVPILPIPFMPDIGPWGDIGVGGPIPPG